MSVISKHGHRTVVRMPKSAIEWSEVYDKPNDTETMYSLARRLRKEGKDLPTFIINGGLYDTKSKKTLTTTVDDGNVIIDRHLFGDWGLELGGVPKFVKYYKGMKEFIAVHCLYSNKWESGWWKGVSMWFGLSKHPRTVVADNSEEHVYMTSDGRTRKVKGKKVRLPGDRYSTIVSFLKWFCENIGACDGGGSTRMGWILNGKLYTLNSPTENRAVANWIGTKVNDKVVDVRSYSSLGRRRYSRHYTRVLQGLLNGLGINCGKVDGWFGRNTERAVKVFQKANGLKVDGWAGQQTWSELYTQAIELGIA